MSVRELPVATSTVLRPVCTASEMPSATVLRGFCRVPGARRRRRSAPRRRRRQRRRRRCRRSWSPRTPCPGDRRPGIRAGAGAGAGIGGAGGVVVVVVLAGTVIACRVARQLLRSRVSRMRFGPSAHTSTRQLPGATVSGIVTPSRTLVRRPAARAAGRGPGDADVILAAASVAREQDERLRALRRRAARVGHLHPQLDRARSGDGRRWFRHGRDPQIGTAPPARPARSPASAPRQWGARGVS